MCLTWQAAIRRVTTLRTTLFTVALSAALLLPMLYSPGIVHADSVVQYGTAWLGGGGVDIMTGGDGSHNCVSVSGAPAQSQCGNVAGKVYAGDKWQCVEMVNRLYLAKGWTTTTWWGNGGGSNSISNDGNLPSGLTRQNNGTISYANSGDVLSLNNDADDAGHAGIIDTIDANGTIHIKSQNADLNSSATITSGSLSAGNASYSMVGWSGYHVRAIVHHPNTPPPPTDSDGDGVPDSQDLAPTMPGPVNNRGVPFYAVNLAGDFNGDGKQDVAAFYNYDSQWTKLWLFAGTGTGGLAAPTMVWDSGINNWSWNNMKPVVGDFNGDGKTDIGVFYGYGNQQTKLWVFYGGSSGLSSPVMIWDSGVGNSDWSHITQISGDFNGDGKTDIGSFYDYSGQTKLWLFTATASGVNAPTIVWDSGVGNADWWRIKPVVGDFNNDGKPDVGMFYNYGNQQTKLWLFAGNGTGGLAAPTIVWDSGVGNSDWNRISQVSGDFNGDGKTDIATFYNYDNQQTKLWLYYGNSSGLSAPTMVWDSGVGNWNWNNMKPFVGDFNADGKTDIGTFYNYGNQQTKLWVFYGSSSGPTASVMVWDSGVGNWDWVRTLVA